MKRSLLEQSDEERYPSHSGLDLACLCINHYSNLPRVAGRKMANTAKLISNNHILRSYLGLLCLGKNDYEAFTAMRKVEYSKNSPDIKPMCRSLSDCANTLMETPSRSCR